MKLRSLGKTNLLVPEIGFGCWAIGGHGYGKVEKGEILKSINHAIDNNIKFFDTANVYGFGESENILGEALLKKRNEVVIASKCGISWDKNGKTYKTLKPNDIEKSLHNSLKRLKTDFIDLYQIHWLDGVTPFDEIMNKLNKFRDQGKIRHIGCSNFNSSNISSFQKIGRVESVQIEYNHIQKDNLNNISAICKLYKMGVITYSLLGRGLLTGRYNLNSTFSSNDTRLQMKIANTRLYKTMILQSKKICEIADNIGITPGQLLIKISLKKSNILCRLIGFTNINQVKDSIIAKNLNLSIDEIRYINKALNS